MKTILALTFLAVSAPALAQAAHDGPAAGHNHAGHAMSATKAAAPAAVRADTAGAVIKVNGLVCDFCVQALTKTFKKRVEVRDFAVDLDAREVRIGFKAGQSIDDATLRKLITDAGYNVVGIARRAAAA